jgi:ribokinase
MTSRVRVAVIGSLNADVTLLVDHLPRPGETVLSSAPGTLGFGGKGGNQAVYAAAFGAEVTMIGRVGDDYAGEQIRTDLIERGIDASHVELTPGTRTGSATVAVNTAGENLILVDPGANGMLLPGDISRDAIEQADAVLLQLEIPIETVSAAAAMSRGPVVLNPAPAVALGPEVIHAIGVLVANLTELASLTGTTPIRPALTGTVQPDCLADIAALARTLSASADVVITLGAGGALVVPRLGTGPALHVATPAVGAVDATGAGDCFCGTLAVSLAEGVSLVSSARVSVAAAALSVTAAGARGLLPTRHEAEALAAGLAVSVVEG